MAASFLQADQQDTELAEQKKHRKGYMLILAALFHQFWIHYSSPKRSNSFPEHVKWKIFLSIRNKFKGLDSVDMLVPF